MKASTRVTRTRSVYSFLVMLYARRSLVAPNPLTPEVVPPSIPRQTHKGKKIQQQPVIQAESRDNAVGLLRKQEFSVLRIACATGVPRSTVRELKSWLLQKTTLLLNAGLI